jgi:phosphatidylserine/phosphatidylglycerophosphate/cardiolipin synthase-like enzyme
MWLRILKSLFVVGALMLVAAPATAQEVLCDPAFEDCRTPLINLIKNETVGIDVAFWFMEDSRYSTELINRFGAGVPIRVIIDPCANNTYPLNADALGKLAAAGIPMRRRSHPANCSGSILHWKMMLFAGQQKVEFSGANYSPNAFVPNEPYKDYVDEVVYFSDDLLVVNSFKTRFDDRWTNTTRFSDYANISLPLVRHYLAFSIDPELQFSPESSYLNRARNGYDAETRQIDVIMYRITQDSHTKAIIAAVNRGIPVRLITEQAQYRLASRYWHSYNVDQLYMAGVQIKHRGHLGLNHQKSILLYGQGMSIFGSSNWTGSSDQSQEEHNYFTKKVSIFNWLQAQFERKWNNSTGNPETIPFVPLQPDKPTMLAPANAALGQPTDVTLSWSGGLYAHKFDVLLDTSPTPSTKIARIELNTLTPPKNDPKNKQTLLVTGLASGTTYYWQVIGETMAAQKRASAIWSFTTGGPVTAPPPNGTLGPGDVLVHAGLRAVIPAGSGWSTSGDASAAGGNRVHHPDAGAPKLGAPLANPTHYFEVPVTVEAGKAYRLWIRGRAERNGWANDSVYVQSSATADANGAPKYRIGTSDATDVNIEECKSCGLAEWGWQDNGWGSGVLGPLLYFATTGTHTLRIQTREDGLSIDQILLSPQQFLTTRPGPAKNDGTVYPETAPP